MGDPHVKDWERLRKDMPAIDGKVCVDLADPVNNPSHYNKGGIECIEAIEQSMTEGAFKGYLKGNVQKYMWRYECKAKPAEDLKKARWYLNKLIEVQEAEDEYFK